MVSNTVYMCGANVIAKFRWESGFLKGGSMQPPLGTNGSKSTLVTYVLKNLLRFSQRAFVRACRLSIQHVGKKTKVGSHKQVYQNLFLGSRQIWTSKLMEFNPRIKWLSGTNCIHGAISMHKDKDHLIDAQYVLPCMLWIAHLLWSRNMQIHFSHKTSEY